MNVIKRNGVEVPFDKSKISGAIGKAMRSVYNDADEVMAESIADAVSAKIAEFQRPVGVEEIQDMVETALMSRLPAVAKEYITYRFKRALARKSSDRDAVMLALSDNVNEDVKCENSNKNPTILSTQRDYVAGEVSKDIARRVLLPSDVVKAHDDGAIHFHDMDYYLQREFNCCLINLKDMLENGTVISGNRIDTPKSFLTACTITTQISIAVAANQYGGQTISLSHLAPFVDVSRRKIAAQVRDELKDVDVTEEKISEIVEERLAREIKAGVQTIQYQVSTIASSNGQAPFISVFMYLNEVPEGRTRNDLALLIREVLKQRLQGVKNKDGVWVSPPFPKLLYVLQEDNITEGSRWWDLTVLAAECTAKRLVPDYISEKKMKEYKKDGNGNGNVYPCMGCRSFLTPDQTPDAFGGISGVKEEGPKYYGRFNQGVCTVNLPYVALEAGSLDKFLDVLDKYLELCHKGLRCRHERLLGTLSDASPIHWQNGAIARLEKGEKIDKLLYGGYSTLSLGYAGLWEAVFALTGKKLTEPEGKELGLKIMQTLNEYTAKWRAAENIAYSLYGTPMESGTYKFAKALQRRFGKVEGVSDKNYITNSYHVKVTEPMTAFDKLALESEFQRLSPGGAISYVEVPDMQRNIPAVLAVMKFIYDNIMYAELNTKSDYCSVCGWDGEISIVTDEGGKLVWECPKCHNRDQNKMYVTRRTCGFIGTQYWNQGRTQEIKERVLHL